MTHSVARIGAAAFALGISLAGPLPVAAADEAVADPTASVSAAGAAAPAGASPAATPGPAAERRTPRGRVRAGLAATGVVPPRAAKGTAKPPVRAAGRARPAASATRLPAMTPVTKSAVAVADPNPSPLLAVPAATAPTPPDAVVLGAAPTASGVTACSVCSAQVATARPPGRLLTNLAFGVERLMDTAGQWISDLRANPITDLLSGALWLVRRTLFPVGADVGRWGSAACVATGDCSGKDLTGADLSKQGLFDVDFTDAILDHANLTLSVLAVETPGPQAAVMVRTSLVGAVLSGADLGVPGSGVDLTGADLRKARFGRPAVPPRKPTAITNVNFTNANLSESELDVSSADMVSAIWTGANLAGQNLSGRNLAGINLTKATLSGVRFCGTSLTGANFTEATLTGLLGSGNADFTGVSDADLVSAVWTGANLSTLDFSNRDLRNINWGAFVNQPRVNLAGAVMTNTRLDDAWLLRADLEGAVLTDSDLIGVQAQGANFFNANLNGVDFTNADLSGADLRGAQVQGVTWTNCTCPDGELAPDSGCQV